MAERIEEGVALRVPCRVITKPSPDGRYVKHRARAAGIGASEQRELRAMIAKLLEEKEEAVRPNGPPHLSHSRINRYLLCPEQYRLYYVEKLKPRMYSASLVFGQVVHQALLVKFIAEELRRIGNVTATEKAFELGVTGIEEPFIGVIDLVAD
jgi:hypothetical protein